MLGLKHGPEWIKCSIGTCAPSEIDVVLDANGFASITADMVDAGTADNCSIDMLEIDIDSFTCEDVGAPVTVTLTATDVNGNIASATAVVTVVDNVPPDVITQNITIFLDEDGFAGIVPEDIDNGSWDACGIESMALSQSEFTCEDVGDNLVFLDVTDVNGNLNTNIATVTVIDNIAPVVVANNIMVHLDITGNASITGEDVDGGSSDACGIASYEVFPNTFDCSSVGNNNVTLTVTDVNGNSASATAVVLIVDPNRPNVVTRDITIYLDESGQAEITAVDIDGGSGDVCGIASLSVSPNTFTCEDVGENEVTLMATDVNGNVSIGRSIVTVIDTIQPVAVAKDITVNINVDGFAFVDPSDIDDGSYAACDLTMTVSPDTFTCADLGPNLVTLTVTNSSGETSIATATVNVVDNVDPIIECTGTSFSRFITTEGGNVRYVVEGVEFDATAFDACGIASLTYQLSGATTGVGVTLDGVELNEGTNVIVWTAVDNNGNEASCSMTVTVFAVDVTNVDELQPSAIDLNVFPNPFTDRVTFRFTPQSSDRALIEIFNMSGARVAVVFDETVVTGQTYEVQYLPQIHNTIASFETRAEELYAELQGYRFMRSDKDVVPLLETLPEVLELNPEHEEAQRMLKRVRERGDQLAQYFLLQARRVGSRASSYRDNLERTLSLDRDGHHGREARELLDALDSEVPEA